ncbi:SCO2400 family protein, partial [Streptomyces scabiei]
MDYCHPCQRHLNGAFSCSGCGASAEECRTHPDALSAGAVPPSSSRTATRTGRSFPPGTARSARSRKPP